MFPQILPLLKKSWLYIVVAVIVLCVAWQLWKPSPPVPEVYAPAVKQSDGSVILEKKPDASAKPATVLPKGAVLERKVSVTVQAKSKTTIIPTGVSSGSRGRQTLSATFNSASDSANATTSGFDPGGEGEQSPSATNHDAGKMVKCPPVTVDLSLIRMPDETRRVIASSPDGEIIGGVDVPVETAQPIAKPKVWAAGAVVNPFKQTYGGFIDRDMGWFRTGLQVNQASEQKGVETWVKAGIIF